MFRIPALLFSALLLALFVLPSTAMAQDFRFPVQGFLTDDAGAPVHGNVDIRFRLYDDEGNSVHQEIAEIAVNQGSFRYYLGSSTEAGEELDPALFEAYQALELGIRVGSDDEMTPRMAIERVPFAAHAARADHALSADEADYALEAGFADVAATAEDIQGGVPIYRITNSLCFETTGTLSFSSTCRVQNRDLDSCPACEGTLTTRKIRSCDGTCGCATNFLIFCPVGQICDNRSYGASCPNERVGRLVPDP